MFEHLDKYTAGMLTAMSKRFHFVSVHGGTIHDVTIILFPPGVVHDGAAHHRKQFIVDEVITVLWFVNKTVKMATGSYPLFGSDGR